MLAQPLQSCVGDRVYFDDHTTEYLGTPVQCADRRGNDRRFVEYKKCGDLHSDDIRSVKVKEIDDQYATIATGGFDGKLKDIESGRKRCCCGAFGM